MRFPSKLILQAIAFFAVLTVAGVFFARVPLNRFFKINRAHYQANVSQWRKALDILDQLEPKGTQARAYAQVKMDALMQLGYPIGAIEAWEVYRSTLEASAPPEYEPLYGFALMLGHRFEAAREHFALGTDEFARAMAEYLAAPGGGGYKRARDLASAKYERRWLYVGTIEWIEGRTALAQSRNERAVIVLRPLVERFPRHIVFGFDLGQAYLATGEIGLANSYLLAGYQGLESRYPLDSAKAIREEWRKIIAEELVLSIYSGNPTVALRIMRALGEPLDLDLQKPATILLAQDELSPAVAFELHALLNRQPKLREKLTGGRGALDRHRGWLEWFSPALATGAALGDPVPPRILSKSKLTGGKPVELLPGTSQWSVSVPAPLPEVGRRLVLLRMKSAGLNGVGGAYVFNMGWKADSGYVGEQSEWQAFDLPLTVDDAVQMRFLLRTESLAGIDLAGQEGERAISIEDALLIDFRRAPTISLPGPDADGF